MARKDNVRFENPPNICSQYKKLADKEKEKERLVSSNRKLERMADKEKERLADNRCLTENLMNSSSSALQRTVNNNVSSRVQK